MFRTKSTANIQLAMELYKIREAGKAAKKREKEILEIFGTVMDIRGDNCISADKVTVLRSERQRRSLDKDLLTAELGDLKPFEKVSSYNQFTVTA